MKAYIREGVTEHESSVLEHVCMALEKKRRTLGEKVSEKKCFLPFK